MGDSQEQFIQARETVYHLELKYKLMGKLVCMSTNTVAVH